MHMSTLGVKQEAEIAVLRSKTLLRKQPKLLEDNDSRVRKQ
jgi:hypothetical protein